MLSIFYQSTENEDAQIGWNSSIFVSYFYQDFIKQKYEGGSPQASRDYKISVKLVSCLSNEKG